MGKKLTKLPKIKYCKIYYDRHGGLRIYVRSQGKTHPEQMLNKIGTPEFEIEKGQKLQQLNQRTSKVVYSNNSLKSLYQKYIQSSAAEPLGFESYAPETKKRKKLRLEPIIKAHGHKLYTDMETRHVVQILDAKKDTPHASDNLRKDLLAMFNWALGRGICPKDFRNPVADTRRSKKVKKEDGSEAGHHTWTQKEFEQFQTYWPVGTMQRLALELLYYTGVRRSDVYRLGKFMIEPDGSLKFKVKKGTNILLPMHPELKRIIALTPIPKEENLYLNNRNGTYHFMRRIPGTTKFKKQSLKTADIIEARKLRDEIVIEMDGNPNVVPIVDENDTFLRSSTGNKFKSGDSFGNWFKDACDKAKLTNCSAHGIRKRLATDMKQSGATDNELKAMFNWQNDAQIKVYTATINNKKMAQQAIDKLNNERKKVKSV